MKQDEQKHVANFMIGVVMWSLDKKSRLLQDMRKQLKSLDENFKNMSAAEQDKMIDDRLGD